MFSAGHGPAHLPSAYLESFRENGWVCLPSIVAPDILEELERVSCTGRWEAETYERRVPPLNETAAVAKIITEPVSLWLMRQYMKTHEIPPRALTGVRYTLARRWQTESARVAFRFPLSLGYRR